MKKLMVAAVAIAMAIASQAATVNWTATAVYTGNATDKASGIAYFMVTDAQPTSAFTTGLTHAQLTDLVGSAYSWTPSTAGTYSVPTTAAVANATLGLEDSHAYTAYLVIFDGATIDASKNFYVSNAKDFSTMGGTTNIGVSFGSQKTASQNAANWTEIAPEPTSGLMMLLGMGVLALRRRRA